MFRADLMPGMLDALPLSNAVWVIGCGERVAPSLSAYLTDADAERASRYRQPARRALCLTARAVLRLRLSRLLGCPARQLIFEPNAMGKPVLTRPSGLSEPGLDFSLSYAKGVAAIAVSPFPVGVDIERVTDFPEMETIARDVFSARIAARLDRAGGEDRLRQFHAYWTLYEAVSKATGLGMVRCAPHLDFDAKKVPVLTAAPDGFLPANRWSVGHHRFDRFEPRHEP